jgi:hypothetical protein
MESRTRLNTTRLSTEWRKKLIDISICPVNGRRGAPETTFEIYEDLDLIWKQLLEKSGIPVIETLTHGEIGLTVIEKRAKT